MSHDDYSGDMSVFEKMLAEAGVSNSEFCLGNYIGLTYPELMWTVRNAIIRHQMREQEAK